jgi:hypothetical protein
MEHEQVNQVLARRSALVYLPLSLSMALLFLLAATLDDYPLVARLGGAVWVWVLSLIVTMPIVTTRVKQHARTTGAG